MLRITSRALLALAIGTLAAWGADNSIGVWKLNIAKSNYVPGPMPLKSYTTVREAAPGGVKVSLGGERVDGIRIKATYTAKFDGTAVAVAGSGTPYDSISIKQVDANTFTYEIKQSSNKYRATGRTVVSSNGKTMTTTAKGTDAEGNPMGLTLVFEKQ